jgi:hypothetical protein
MDMCPYPFVEIVQNSLGYYLNTSDCYSHSNFTGNEVADHHGIQCPNYSPGDCLKCAFYWFVCSMAESDDFAFTGIFLRVSYKNIEHFPSELIEQM